MKITVATQLYRAHVKDTDETLSIGNFGHAYDLVYGTYEERQGVSPEAVQERMAKNDIEKLFDFREDYSSSNSMANWFELALETLADNQKHGDDRDMPEQISEALESAISVYTADLLQAAIEDLTLATEAPELQKEDATGFDLINLKAYEILSEALADYIAVLEKVEA